MRSSTSQFDERGHDALVRDVEELNLQLADLGVEAEGLSQSLVKQQVTTNSAINQAVAAHEAKANPHPQYLLASSYSAQTFTGFSARKQDNSVPSALAYATLTFNSQEYDPSNLYTAGVFTAPTTGVYSFAVAGTATIDAATAGSLALFASYVAKNGSSDTATSPSGDASLYAPDTTNDVSAAININGAVSLTAGETLEYKRAYILLSGSLGASAVYANLRFTVFRLGD